MAEPVLMMMMIKLMMREEGKVTMGMIRDTLPSSLRMVRDQGEVLALSFNPHIQILATGGYY